MHALLLQHIEMVVVNVITDLQMHAHLGLTTEDAMLVNYSNGRLKFYKDY